MYILLLIMVTASLVATAAYFSVVGIASIFAYNYVAALILGSALEAGKISVAVYLYRYWRMIPDVFRGILIMFLTVLMFITSVGIFGFLSQGYQKTAEEYRLIRLELGNLEGEFSEKKRREGDINRQVEQLPPEAVLGRIRLSREFGDELAELRDRLSIIEPRIHTLHMKSLEYESHLGPISYVAKMLGMSEDKTVLFAILLLVFVADPLAVTLTVACNMALIRFLAKDRSRKRSTKTVARPNLIDKLLAKAESIAHLSYYGTFAEQPKKAKRRTTAARRTAKRPAAAKPLRAVGLARASHR